MAFRQFVAMLLATTELTEDQTEYQVNMEVNMAHFKAESKEKFWEAFQKHMGYTEQDMKWLRKDPRRLRYAPIMGSPAVQDQTLFIEVVEAHGCANGMKPGDKLVFEGCGLLDPERSDRWCGNALNEIGMISYACHCLLLHGMDANEIYSPYFSCTDCGTKYGWGQVIMRARIEKEPKGTKSVKTAKGKASKTIKAVTKGKTSKK